MKFFEELTTLNWWLSVFVFGIIFRLFNHYLQKYLDKLVDSRKEKNRTKIELLTKYEDERIEKINNDVVEYEKMKLDISYKKYLSILYLLIGMAFIILASSETKLKYKNLELLSINDVIAIVINLGVVFSFARSLYLITKVLKLYSLIDRTKYGN